MRNENFNESSKGNLENVTDEDYLYNDFDGNGDIGSGVDRQSSLDIDEDNLIESDVDTGIGSNVDTDLDTGTNRMGTHGNVGKNRGDI